ncbi:putative transporter [Lachnellula suecica]|uniref:Putative transporter n=1 Tax=Lachnellula suecica TaxID=602035 RepID=A0A8T9C757_9HELO|nr:putative transporter [Lachnellula suecica]
MVNLKMVNLNMDHTADRSAQHSPSSFAPIYSSKRNSKNETAMKRTSKTSAIAALEMVQAQDPRHPMHWSACKRWGIVTVYCFLQMFVLLTATTYVGVEYTLGKKWGTSPQANTLGQSMFILGNAIGPVFMGPLSDIAGRKWVYVGSILAYALLNLGCAYAVNLPMLVIFMFLIGTAGSTAVSNVAGTISDLFGDIDGAGQAMALFVVSANVGPSLGSPVGAWIDANPKLGWRWIFLINVVIGVGFAIIMCFVPETLPSLVILEASKARSNQDGSEAPPEIVVREEWPFVISFTFRIMLTEPIVLVLGLYNGFIYGIMFLYLDGVYDVFAENNHLSIVSANLTYLNFVVGVLVMFAFIPVQTWFYARDRRINGINRPEARFITSLVTVWLFPITLIWFGWTSDGKTSYWSPIIAGGILGFADPLLWLAMLNYITDAYPRYAASAIAAFLIPSFIVAAGMAHLGLLIFERMSTKWAMTTIGLVSIFGCIMVYVIFFFGHFLRKKSILARNY